jgi:hypothetical protein
MKKKEKIDWGVLSFVFIFCFCLKLGMHLDLKNPTYPNDLNAYHEKALPAKSGCCFDMFSGSDSGSPSINNIDGNIR